MLVILVALLRVLVVLLLVRLLARFVAAVIRGYLGAGSARSSEGSASRGAPTPEVQLVRDPVCNTFVDPKRAVTREVNGRLAYYCSVACRDRSFVLAAAR